MCKPNWNQAPEFANWLTQDEDGDWWWFENEPSADLSTGRWDASDGDRDQLITIIDNWEDTKEARPLSAQRQG